MHAYPQRTDRQTDEHHGSGMTIPSSVLKTLKSNNISPGNWGLDLGYAVNTLHYDHFSVSTSVFFCCFVCVDSVLSPNDNIKKLPAFSLDLFMNSV